MKIGAFARACGVNRQTLRYYDSIGLFPADHVDGESGYRYYNPARIRDFKMITELKELGFSLEEIKFFLSATEEGRQLLLSEKRKALQERIQTENERIRQIDAQSGAEDRLPSPLFTYLNQPFENDPEVIGQWVLCGALPRGDSFTGEKQLLPCEGLLKKLYFLPGGAYVYNYFWSRGVLYRLGENTAQHIASPYHTFTHGKERYLSLAHPEEKHLHIYRQMDNAVYTESQAYDYKDKVDLPFVPDERLLGVWDTVGILSDPEKFVDLKEECAENFFIKGMVFYERGMCQKLLKNSGNGYPRVYSYTKGLILDKEMSFAEHYKLCQRDDNAYLITEHKTGDYAYLGKIFCYYVFKKRKEP